MSCPMISVIIPVYNAGRFIERAITSVINQTVTDWELILVDDGSKDDSLAICRRMALTDSRIRVYTKPNGGEASARNFGLDHAVGKYVCYVDADDHVSPTLLEDYLCDRPADLAICGIRMDWGAAVNEYRLPEGEHSGDDIIHTLSRLNILPVGSSVNKLYRRDLIESQQIRFPVELQGVGMDHAFNWSYFQLCRSMRTVGRMNYIYEENPDSMSHERSAANPVWFAEKRLNMMSRLNSIFASIPDERLRGECQKIYHTYFSDTIIRPLYIHAVKADDRRRILSGYKKELKSFRFNTLAGSEGLFNRIINILQRMPADPADGALRLLFGAKNIISRG